MPWPGVGDADIIESINAGSKLERPPGVPLSCYDLMLACWHLEPDDRPTATELIKMIEQLDGEDMVAPSTDAPILNTSQKGKLGQCEFINSTYIIDCTYCYRRIHT